MHIEELGAGNALLILHGTPSTGAMIRMIGEWLADESLAIIPDLPGYRSSPFISPYSLENIRAALLDELARRDIQELAIIGHSFGAYRALDLTLNSELNVTSLALLGAISHYPEELHQGIRDFADALRQNIDLCPIAAERWFSSSYRQAHPEILETLRIWWDQMDPETMAADLEAMVACQDLRSGLPELDIPVYLRVGTADLPTPPAWSEEIHELLPASTLDIVDGVGHFLHLEDPANTRKALRSFFHS